MDKDWRVDLVIVLLFCFVFLVMWLIFELCHLNMTEEEEKLWKQKKDKMIGIQ